MGDEKAAADRMEQFWIMASKDPLYKNWFGGIMTGLFAKGGLYNPQPLKDFLKSNFKGIKLLRHLNFGLTNLLSGDFKDFNEKSLTSSGMIIDALFASMATPGYLPPADVMSSSWYEGDAIYDIDVFSIINYCKAQGYDDQDIVIDVLMSSSGTLEQVDASNFTSLAMLKRFIQVHRYYSSMQGLLKARFAYPTVNFRSVISPTTKLSNNWKPYVRISCLSKKFSH